jgi:hypothetical protein
LALLPSFLVSLLVGKASFRQMDGLPAGLSILQRKNSLKETPAVVTYLTDTTEHKQALTGAGLNSTPD